MLTRYAEEITPQKEGARQERGRIDHLQKYPLAAQRLISLRSADFAEFCVEMEANNQFEVFTDSDVRSGRDVFMAQALCEWSPAGRGIGARVWREAAALNLRGKFHPELEVAMALSGVSKVSENRREATDKIS